MILFLHSLGREEPVAGGCVRQRLFPAKLVCRVTELEGTYRPLAPTTKLLGNDGSSSIVSDVDVLVIRVGD